MGGVGQDAVYRLTAATRGHQAADDFRANGLFKSIPGAKGLVDADQRVADPVAGLHRAHAAQDQPVAQRPFHHEIRPLFTNGVHYGQRYRFRNVGLIQCSNGDLLAFPIAPVTVPQHMIDRSCHGGDRGLM